MFIAFREKRRERERKRSMWKRNINVGIFPYWESNLQPFGDRMMLQATEPPGQGDTIFLG